MPIRPASALRGERRLPVYLLFAAVLLYFVAGLLIRNRVGEIYPGLYMPGFPGYGLTRMTAAQGETEVLRIRVDFADGSYEWVPVGRFCGDIVNSFVMAHQVFLPGVDEFKRGMDVRDRLRLMAIKFREGPRRAAHDNKILMDLPPDIRDFLAARTRALFPGRVPTCVTLKIDHVRFPLTDPNRQQLLETACSVEITVTP